MGCRIRPVPDRPCGKPGSCAERPTGSVRYSTVPAEGQEAGAEWLHTKAAWRRGLRRPKGELLQRQRDRGRRHPVSGSRHLLPGDIMTPVGPSSSAVLPGADSVRYERSYRNSKLRSLQVSYAGHLSAAAPRPGPRPWVASIPIGYARPPQSPAFYSQSWPAVRAATALFRYAYGRPDCVVSTRVLGVRQWMSSAAVR